MNGLFYGNSVSILNNGVKTATGRILYGNR